MTSSLVGSEMCIRDRRFILVGKPVRRVLPLCYIEHHWSLISKGVRLPRSCLLYTSDAADDM
eukprot:1886557-Prorocentrum_lima.AAC.1